MNTRSPIPIVGARKKRCLAPEALQQSVKELQLVKPVHWKMQRIGRRPQIDGRRNSDYRVKYGRRGTTKFARKLQDEVSPHRIADQRHRSQTACGYKEVHHREHIVREPRMV